MEIIQSNLITTTHRDEIVDAFENDKAWSILIKSYAIKNSVGILIFDASMATSFALLVTLVNGVLVLVLLVVLVGFWVLAGNRLVGWVVELLLPLLLLPEIPRTLLIFCIPKQAFCIVSFRKNATICNANKCMQKASGGPVFTKFSFLAPPPFSILFIMWENFPTNQWYPPASHTLNQQ